MVFGALKKSKASKGGGEAEHAGDQGQGGAPGNGTDHARGLELHGHSLKPWHPCGPAHASGR